MFSREGEGLEKSLDESVSSVLREDKTSVRRER